MTAASPALTLPDALHEPPAAVRVRGTIALVAGAGEAAPVYARFGRRLSADGYAVGVFELHRSADAAGWLAEQEQTPRVLAGSDRGAAAALALAAEGSAVLDGVLIAGLPVGADDARAEASQRTACPVHLGVLAQADAGAVSAPVPEADVPDAAALASVAVPVLAVHGGADPLSPLTSARAVLAALPALELVETVGGLHDAFNDQSHRSVAATVVLWLERLRAGDIARSIVRAVAR